MESTEAGWARTLFSETREAAEYWAIMNPEFNPPSLMRKAGNPLSMGLTRRSTRRSEMLASSARAMPRKSMARATGCPWKLPPRRKSCSSRKMSGLLVEEFISTSKTPQAYRMASWLAPCTWGGTAQGVRVLDAGTVLVGRDDLAVLGDAQHVVRGRGLTRMGPRPLYPLVELGAAAHEHFQAHGSRDVRDLAEPQGVVRGQAADGGHDLGPVDQGQPFGGLPAPGVPGRSGPGLPGPSPRARPPGLRLRR